MADMPHGMQTNDPIAVERPEPGPASAKIYGSDRIADTIRALGVPLYRA